MAQLIKVTGHGVTTEIHPSDLDLYKRAGYEVVADPKPEPVKEPEPEPTPEAPVKKSKK